MDYRYLAGSKAVPILKVSEGLPSLSIVEKLLEDADKMCSLYLDLWSDVLAYSLCLLQIQILELPLAVR